MLQNYIFSGNPAIFFNEHPDLFGEKHSKGNVLHTLFKDSLALHI